MSKFSKQTPSLTSGTPGPQKTYVPHQKKHAKGFDSLGQTQPRLTWPDLHKWKEDGIDHVCIDANAVTKLGKLLTSMSNRFSFVTKWHGEFRTIEGFMVYLGAPKMPDREKLRGNRGDTIAFLKNKARMFTEHVPNFKAIVADAIVSRFEQNPELKKVFEENALDVDIYSIDQNTGLRVRDSASSFLLYSIYVKMYECMDDGIEFKPDMFQDDFDSDDIYSKVVPQYQRDFLANKAAKEIEDAAKAQADAVAKATAERLAAEARALIQNQQMTGSIINPMHFLKKEVAISTEGPVDESNPPSDPPVVVVPDADTPVVSNEALETESQTVVVAPVEAVGGIALPDIRPIQENGHRPMRLEDLASLLPSQPTAEVSADFDVTPQ